MLWFAIRPACFHSIFTTFLKDHASQILSKGPISTKELQDYSKFGGWYVEFYGYVCTSSAEADWRKRDLVLQGFFLWTKSMAWPEHLHTPECLMKGPFFLSPDASRLQARQAAGRGRSCLKKNVPWSELTYSWRCTCTPTGINFVVRNRHKSWGYAQHFNWPISTVKGCTELFFQKHSEAQSETQGYAASNPSSPLKCTSLFVHHFICLFALPGFYEDSV